MAFQDVSVPDSEPSTYFKFNAIGDRLAGVLLGSGPATGQYGAGKTEYRFRTKDGDVALTPPYHAAKALSQADVSGILKPGAQVILTYTANKPIGKESPMKVFTLKVNPETIGKIPPPVAPKPAAPAVADDFAL